MLGDAVSNILPRPLRISQQARRVLLEGRVDPVPWPRYLDRRFSQEHSEVEGERIERDLERADPGDRRLAGHERQEQQRVVARARAQLQLEVAADADLGVRRGDRELVGGVGERGEEERGRRGAREARSMEVGG